MGENKTFLDEYGIMTFMECQVYLILNTILAHLMCLACLQPNLPRLPPALLVCRQLA